MDDPKEYNKSLKEKAEHLLANKKEMFNASEYEDLNQIVHELQVHQVELEIQNEELKRIQTELQASKDSYKQLFEFSSEGIVLIDKTGIIRHLNFTFSKWVGLDKTDVINKPFVDFIDQDDRQIFRGRYTAFFKIPKGKKIEVKLAATGAQNPPRFVLIQGRMADATYPFETLPDLSKLLVLSISDIHDMKTAQQKEQQLADTFRNVIAKTPIGLCITDENGIFEFVNTAYCSIYGYSEDELLGRHFTIVVPDKLKAQLSDLHDHFIRKKEEIRGEWQVLTKTGEQLAVIADAAWILGDDNRPKKVTFVVDITERKKLETSLEVKVKERTRELLENETRLRELFDNMSAGVAVYTSPDNGNHFIFKEMNRAGLVSASTRKEEIIGREVREVFPGVTDLGLFEVFQRVWKTKESEFHPTRMYADERLKFWVENYVYKLPSDELVAIYTDVTSQKRAELLLAQSEAKFKSLVESSSDLIWETNEDWRYTYLSPGAEDLFGFTPEELLNKSFFSRTSEETRHKLEQKLNQFKENAQVFSKIEYVNHHKNGTQIIIEISGIPFFSNSGRLMGYRGLSRDITDKKLHEETLLLTDSVFENTIEGIAVTDPKGNIQKINEAFTSITGYSEQEVLGKNPSILKSDRHSEDFYHDMWKSIQGSGYWSGEIWNRRKDGSVYPEWLSISAIRETTGEIKHYVSLFHDISEQKMQNEKLQFLSFHDPLTKLPNRALFYDRANVAIRRARRSGNKLALLFLDLDNFQNINDSYGHPLGDDFLCLVKDRIASICREVDTFARYGGDEFVIMLNDIISHSDVKAFSERIIELFQSPFIIMDEELYSSVSIGLSIFPDDGSDITTLEKNADLALLEAKKRGKKRSFFYSKKLRDKMTRQSYIENEMRKAIQNFKSFHLLYQPKVLVEDRTIHSVEALIRWELDGALISPAEFIPIAEASDLIIPIGNWVMKEAMTEMKRIHNMGFDDISLSINLSSQQFTDKDLIHTIGENLAATGYDTSRLYFEITETMSMTDTNKAIDTMQKISQLGIKLSMDDFGTGYSSLNAIKKFPLAELKIDRSFVTGLPDDSDDAAITRTILQLAKGLNFEVVAEGVETERQLQFLEENGCEIIQGYLFYKPISIENLINIL